MIFFDVANTLLHKPDVFTNIQSVLKSHDIEISLDHINKTHKALSEVLKFPDKTSKDWYKVFNRELLFALGVIPSDELVVEVFEACTYNKWLPFEDSSVLYDFTGDLGVISNWDGTLRDKLKEFFTIDFKVVIGSKEFGLSKPNPKIFEEAIKQSGKPAQELVYIGDSIKLDMVESLNQGFRSILIDRDNVYPYYNGERVQSLHELKNLLG